jgi:hypothetical protein
MFLEIVSRTGIARVSQDLRDLHLSERRTRVTSP